MVSDGYMFLPKESYNSFDHFDESKEKLKDSEQQNLIHNDSKHSLPEITGNSMQKMPSSNFNIYCMKYVAWHFYHRQRQLVIPFIWGILVGVALTTILFQQSLLYSHSVPWQFHHLDSSLVGSFHGRYIPVSDKKEAVGPSLASSSTLEIEKNVKQNLSIGFNQKLVLHNQAVAKTSMFVGVITAGKFLASRAAAVNSTWGLQVDGVEFFTQHGSSKEHKLPVVNLEGVSDREYPPQKKAFKMLKHMCDHHIDDYEWFVRADDDVYIRVERLKRFLSTIDNDRMIYMGQPGHGVPEVRDKLGLRGHNFCMGGPGVIFNRKALKGLCPHIDDCMAEVASGEEDVEIGRCVTNHIHIECTHAWETLKLFYHSYQEEYKEEKPFLGNLAENDHVSGALTLHHLKVPYIMYKVHRHYSSLELNETVQKIAEVRQSLKRVNSELPLGLTYNPELEKPIPLPFRPDSMSQSHSWKTFNTDAIYTLSPADVMNDITNDVLADLKQIGESGIDEAIGQSQGQQVTYSHVSDGYVRSDYERGTDYLLDVYFNSRTQDVANQIRRVQLLRPAGALVASGSKRRNLQAAQPPVYVLLATNKVSRFENFMRSHLEPAFLLAGASVNLLVVSTDDGRDDTGTLSFSLHEVVSWYREKYPGLKADVLPQAEDVDRAFARGIVHINQLLESNNPRKAKQNAVVLLTTTNVRFAQNAINRCISRTFSVHSNEEGANCHDISSQSSHVYQPLPFTSYSIDEVQAKIRTTSDTNSMQTYFNSDNGFWNLELSGNSRPVTPLCGRIFDFYEPARVALKTGADMLQLSFSELLYQFVYNGTLSLVRSPDQSYFNIPTR